MNTKFQLSTFGITAIAAISLTCIATADQSIEEETRGFSLKAKPIQVKPTTNLPIQQRPNKPTVEAAPLPEKKDQTQTSIYAEQILSEHRFKIAAMNHALMQRYAPQFKAAEKYLHKQDSYKLFQKEFNELTSLIKRSQSDPAKVAELRTKLSQLMQRNQKMLDEAQKFLAPKNRQEKQSEEIFLKKIMSTDSRWGKAKNRDWVYQMDDIGEWSMVAKSNQDRLSDKEETTPLYSIWKNTLLSEFPADSNGHSEITPPGGLVLENKYGHIDFGPGETWHVVESPSGSSAFLQSSRTTGNGGTRLFRDNVNITDSGELTFIVPPGYDRIAIQSKLTYDLDVNIVTAGAMAIAGIDIHCGLYRVDRPEIPQLRTTAECWRRGRGWGEISATQEPRFHFSDWEIIMPVDPEGGEYTLRAGFITYTSCTSLPGGNAYVSSEGYLQVAKLSFNIIPVGKPVRFPNITTNAWN